MIQVPGIPRQPDPYIRVAADQELIKLGHIKYLVQQINDELADLEGGITTITGLNTDNSNPSKPIIKISVDGSTITGLGTPLSPLVAHGSGVDFSGTVAAGLTWLATSAALNGMQAFLTNPTGIDNGILLSVIVDTAGNKKFATQGKGMYMNPDWGTYTQWNGVKGTMAIDHAQSQLIVIYNSLVGGVFSGGAATIDGHAVTLATVDSANNALIIENYSSNVVTGVISQGGVTANVEDKFYALAGYTITDTGWDAICQTKADDTSVSIDLNMINGNFNDPNWFITDANGGNFNFGSHAVYFSAPIVYTNQYATDDIVIDKDPSVGWFMWENLTGNNTSTRPYADATNWSKLSKTVLNGYILQECESEYDITADTLRSRRQMKTSTLGELYCEQGWCTDIPFGRPDTRGIAYGNPALCTLYKIDLKMRNFTYNDGVTLLINEFNNDILNTRLGTGSTLDNCGDGSQNIHAILESGAVVENMISVNSFSFGILTYADGQGLYFCDQGALENYVMLTMVGDIQNGTVGLKSSDAYTNLDALANYSGTTLTFPDGSNYIGSFILTTATGGNISKLLWAGTSPVYSTNPPGFRFRIYGAAGITNTFLPIAIGSALAGDIISDVIAPIVLVGRSQGSDWIEFEVQGNLISVVNSSIKSN